MNFRTVLALYYVRNKQNGKLSVNSVGGAIRELGFACKTSSYSSLEMLKSSSYLFSG